MILASLGDVVRDLGAVLMEAISTPVAEAPAGRARGVHRLCATSGFTVDL
jgi:hypothetical protein